VVLVRDDDELEWKLRAAAVPAAFVLALAFHATSTGHFLQRTFLTMIPHELGHAMTAWWCGFAAIPGLWKTLIPETRSVVIGVLVFAVEAGLVWLGWRTQRSAWWIAGLALAALQFLGTLSLTTEHAQMAITFGGDGGALVIGAGLVLLFFVPRGSRLHQHHLRWGLLAIGAATLVDTAATWFAARSDHDAIPFGEIEGVGLSDPSKLADVYGWSARQIATRYANLATVCLIVVAIGWAWAVWSARKSVRASAA
jgi:hypothetical protein